MPEATELHRRARRAANRAAFARSSALLGRALEATDDPDLIARIELTRAYIESETGDAAGGLARCERLVEQASLTTSTQGLIWSQLGLLRMRTGQSDLALSALARAVELHPDQGEYLGRALLNRGNVHLQRGDVSHAVADFTAARDELARVGLTLQQAKVEHNLGYARMLSGDLVGAIKMIDAAAVVLRPVSATFRATVEQDRAEILTAAGLPREASRALESAASAYGARRLRTSQADCELTLAWTVLRQDPKRARVVARRAARRFRAQASPVRALQADAVALVAEISTGATTHSVLDRADALVAELHQHGHVRDATILQLQGARVCVARGELSDASTRLGLARIDGATPVTTRLLWREVRAELSQARGDGHHARHHVRTGLDELHTWQSSFGSLDLQSTLVAHGRDLARMGLALALEHGDPALVFEWSERARALVGRVAPVRAPLDEQVSRDLTELRLLQESQPKRRTAEARRVEELRQRVRQRSWYGEGKGSVTDPARIDELRPALEADHAALLSHIVVRGRVAALLVTPEQAQVVDICDLAGLRDRLDAITADLTMAASHRSDDLAGPVRASLRAHLDTLSRQLLRPVVDLLGDRRVVLSPSGMLAGTPWSLLPGLIGRPLTIPPSATRWLELRQVTRSGERRVGLVAGPGVARGPEEVTRAAAAWPGATVLCREDATAARVTDLAAEVDLLHLAGHGRHTGENPLFSAIELIDGPWFGYDIDQLTHTPETVVLSACELGRVSLRSGEEAIGMSAAWLHAGARTVLSSPVLIADDVACEALAGWHAAVARGAAPADALAEVSAAADDFVPLLTFGGGW